MGHACNRAETDGSHNETEANLFASELLIPTKFLQKDFKITKDIPTLAKNYLVSSQAMGIKLMEARLLK
jgi:Zn-dependent peptidase ImmA (M78 family)